jgi:hypothetical protein
VCAREAPIRTPDQMCVLGAYHDARICPISLCAYSAHILMHAYAQYLYARFRHISLYTYMSHTVMNEFSAYLDARICPIQLCTNLAHIIIRQERALGAQQARVLLEHTDLVLLNCILHIPCHINYMECTILTILKILMHLSSWGRCWSRGHSLRGRCCDATARDRRDSSRILRILYGDGWVVL